MKKMLFVMIIIPLIIQGASASYFIRGDFNQDTKIDISDPVSGLLFLFQAGAAPSCMDAADSNDDGKVDISDSIYTLRYLFLGSGEQLNARDSSGESIPGSDVTVDELGCTDSAFSEFKYPSSALESLQRMTVFTAEEFDTFLSGISDQDSSGLAIDDLYLLRQELSDGKISLIDLALSDSNPSDENYLYPLTYSSDGKDQHLLFAEACGESCCETVQFAEMLQTGELSVTTDPVQPPSVPHPPVSEPPSPGYCCEYKVTTKEKAKQVCIPAATTCPPETTIVGKVSNIRVVPGGKCNSEMRCEAAPLTGCCSFTCSNTKRTVQIKTCSTQQITKKDCYDKCTPTNSELCSGIAEKCIDSSWSPLAECKEYEVEGKKEKRCLSPINGICTYLSILQSLLATGHLDKSFSTEDLVFPTLNKGDDKKAWMPERIVDLQNMVGVKGRGLTENEEQAIYKSYGLICAPGEVRVKNPAVAGDTGISHSEACDTIDKKIRDGCDCSFSAFARIIPRGSDRRVGHEEQIRSAQNKEGKCNIYVVNTGVQKGGFSVTNEPLGFGVPIVPGERAWVIGPDGLTSYPINERYGESWGPITQDIWRTSEISYRCCCDSGTGGV